MAIHTTNYFNTFIEVADDSPSTAGTIPPSKKADDKTIAEIQFEILSRNPYKYTSDEILFQTHALKKQITPGELNREKETFFSKGQPCFRSSPLTKRYGWGIHSNEEGKMALYGQETEEYAKYAGDKKLKQVKAMRSKRV